MSGRFSTYLISTLAEVITGGAGNDSRKPIGIYRSGPRIEQFFLDCGIDMHIGSSSRVPATIEAIRGLFNLGEYGDEKLEKLILKVCDTREYYDEPEGASAVRDYLNRVLEPDGLTVTIVSGKSHLVEKVVVGSIVKPFLHKVSVLNFDTVETDIARAMNNASVDPEDAVTAACSLVEAVCRSILIELGVDLPARRGIDPLYRAVQQPLGLSPGRTDLPSEVEGDVRQILNSLLSTVKGIGALRTHGGDAHGREKGFKRIDSRIARMAIGAASTVSHFLIETWERKEKRALPLHFT